MGSPLNNRNAAKSPDKRRDDQITVRLPTGFRRRMENVTIAKGIPTSSWVADLIGTALVRSERSIARKLNKQNA